MKIRLAGQRPSAPVHQSFRLSKPKLTLAQRKEVVTAATGYRTMPSAARLTFDKRMRDIREGRIEPRSKEEATLAREMKSAGTFTEKGHINKFFREVGEEFIADDVKGLRAGEKLRGTKNPKRFANRLRDIFNRQQAAEHQPAKIGPAEPIRRPIEDIRRMQSQTVEPMTAGWQKPPEPVVHAPTPLPLHTRLAPSNDMPHQPPNAAAPLSSFGAFAGGRISTPSSHRDTDSDQPVTPVSGIPTRLHPGEHPTDAAAPAITPVPTSSEPAGESSGSDTAKAA